MQTLPPSSVLIKKITPYTLLFFITACMGGCQRKSQHKQWDNATIDATLATNAAYRQLDKEREVFSMTERQDTSWKRTSGVAYFTKGHVNLSDSTSARFNNCRAYFVKDSTLSINIGIGNGFGGYGFVIHYKDRKFYTEPYYATDLVIPDQPEPVYELIYQRLTVDKPAYQVGDSLYGEIDFKMVEIDQDNNKIGHSGKGYFRTKIKEL